MLAECERILQETLSKLGGLDIIVSNAVGQNPITLVQQTVDCLVVLGDDCLLKSSA